jgi:tRNA pseudouridine55 synthase
MNLFEEGQLLLINKPFRWTSFDVIHKIRQLIKIKKVGHAGTLDPLATGLLIICTGKFTKKINEYMALEKEYTGSFTLGATTPTYDLESKPENFRAIDAIDPGKIEITARKFTGDILQVPPAHSAIKVGGKRLYELARQGREVNPEPRKIRIKEFQITHIDSTTAAPIVHFRVVCSTGTYIRSLAFDMGEELGCGAYLSSLCRTRIGHYTIQEAMTIELFEEKVKKLSQQ